MANDTQQILSLVFQVGGQEAVAQVAQILKDTGAAGTEASAELQPFIDRLNELGDTSGAISGFVSLKAQLADVEVQLGNAVRGVDELTASFDRNDTSNAKVNAAFALADKTVASLTAKQAQLTLELAKTSGTLEKAGIDTDELSAAQDRLNAETALTISKLQQASAAHAESAAAAEKEAVSVEELGERYAALGSLLENLKTLLLTVGAFAGFEKIKEEIGDVLATGDKFAAFGIEFANAFGGVDPGAEALEKVKQLAETVPLSLDDVAKAALQAKKVGLDPLNGTLQTLINTNAKYGGSVDSLNNLIDAFGKANARGEITQRELVALQQAGVPAAKLLGDAMGKSAEQVNDLAKAGGLGRDAIAQLLQKLSAQSAGDAAKSLNLLSVQTVKVKDDFDEFLKLIADAGVYDFVRDELKQIGDALKTGLGDGTLKEKAQAISDALVAIGNAAVGAVKFLSEHSEAIYEAGKAYAVMRTAMLAVDLAGMARNFLKTTLASAENAAAAQANAAAQVELAAAMRATAAAAATESEALAAGAAVAEVSSASSYEKLGTVLTGLRAQLNGLSSAAKIGIGVAGLDYTYEQAVKLNEALGNLYDQYQKNQQAQKDDLETQTQLSAKAATVAAELKGYADTQVKSIEQISTLSRAQSADYITQLQNAIKYYTALKVQAQASGDAIAASAATTKLKALSAALDETKQHFAPIQQEANKVSDSVKSIIDQILQLRVQGVAATTAVEGAFNDLQIQTPTGFKGLTDALTGVEQLSGDTAAAIQGELVAKLKSLNDLDYEKFKNSLNSALTDGKTNAQALSIALRAGLEADLEKLGISAQDAGEKFTTSGQKIIAAFNSIAQNADATGTQITTAFEQALTKVATQGEVDALKDRLTEAFQQGKISADQYVQGLLAVQNATNGIASTSQKAALALTPVQQALKDLGVQSQQSLKGLADDATKNFATVVAASDGSAASVANNSNAFLAMAKAQLAAAASSDDATKEQVANSLLQQSYTYQDSDAVKALIQQYLHLGQTIGSIPQGNYGPTPEQGAQTKTQLTEEEKQLKAVSDQILGAAASWQTYFSQTSAAASSFYTTLLDRSIGFQSEVDGGVQSFADRINAASKLTTETITAQRAQLQAQIDLINKVGTDPSQGFGALGNSAEEAAKKATDLAAQIAAGTYDAGLLGQQELQPLQAALDAAKQRVLAIIDATKQAQDQLASLGSDLQDQLDEAEGNQDAIEDRRYQKQLADLKAAAQAAGALNSAQYATDVANANKLHQLKIAQIAQQAAAQQAANSGASPSQVAAAGTSSPGSGNSSGTLTTGTQQPTNSNGAALSPIVINVPGFGSATVYGNQDHADNVADLMAKLARGKQLASGFSGRRN